MSKNLFWPRWALATVPILAATWAGAALGPMNLGEEPRRIEVRKIVMDCEGEDCADEEHQVKIFIDKSGEHEVLEGDRQVWVSADDEAHSFSFGGGNHFRHFEGGGKRGFLGVALSELTPELRSHFGVSRDAGVMVSKVSEDSPAERAGVQVGDIITAVNGEAVASGRALAKAIRGHEEGETAALEIRRDGALINLAPAIEVREGMGHRAAHHAMKRIEIRCDGDGNCNHGIDASAFDCGASGECDVRVQCTDAGCDCTINGETADCAVIPGAPHKDE